MGTATQKTIQQLASENRGYFQMAISVDCVIFGFEKNELKVLLIKSDLKEFNNQWSLLGDLVHLNEDPDTASYRVLKEKTGLDDVFLVPQHSRSVQEHGPPAHHRRRADLVRQSADPPTFRARL